jgi:RNA polymerase sigma-70 factor, ECF subfamily
MVSVPEPRRTAAGEDSAFDHVLAAAQRGDEDAFADLWRELQPRLLRFLRARGADRAFVDAETVAGETWLQVARDLPKFTGDYGAFRGWVYAIARNRLIDAQRAEGRRPSVALQDAMVATLAALDDVESQAQANEELSEVLIRLKSLPDGQRDVLLLRVVAGLSVEETAKALGRRPGTVRVLAHRGLKTLQAQMQAISGGPDVT